MFCCRLLLFPFLSFFFSMYAYTRFFKRKVTFRTCYIRLSYPLGVIIDLFLTDWNKKRILQISTGSWINIMRMSCKKKILDWFFFWEEHSYCLDPEILFLMECQVGFVWWLLYRISMGCGPLDYNLNVLPAP